MSAARGGSVQAQPDVTVLFPCYNEEQRLPASLAHTLEYLREHYPNFEVLVIDDGSTDRTVEAARQVAPEESRLRIVRCEMNQGKGAAVARGAAEARGRVVLFSDADLSTPIEELARFLERQRNGADIVIGSRALAESQLEVRQPWWREKAGRLMNAVIRLTSGLEFVDTQCGFKLFTREAARDIFPQLRTRTWMFDVEVLVIAQKLGYQIADLPVVWRNSGDSRVKASHAPRILRELLTIRWFWLRHKPQRCTAESTEPAACP